ncbi:Ubiquitin-like_domain superfamily [Hexamita inflata]|uniref:Ubiquitin-like domain superfamily n=1 Tax=Hexamita inflata TaxID=28002 RepID=A0AA86URE6_9EUKA|nr:Ubiquitin-like domain superfamily [Hexamita inflata]
MTILCISRNQNKRRFILSQSLQNQLKQKEIVSKYMRSDFLLEKPIQTTTVDGRTLRVYFQNKCTQCKAKLSDKVDSLKKQMSVWKQNPYYSILYQNERVKPQLTFADYGILDGEALTICKKNVTNYKAEITQIEEYYTRIEEESLRYWGSSDDCYEYYGQDVYSAYDDFWYDDEY